MTDPLTSLRDLSNTLGEPHRDLVILAEGNTSVRTAEGRMIVKATGSRMPSATDADFVEVDTAPLLELVASTSTDDELVSSVLMDARLDPEQPRPSMEALVHAICLEEAGASVVAHTHPLHVNAILCSTEAGRLVGAPLFPDQVVVLGRHNVLVPYADPGLALARAVRRGLREHIDAHGVPPKVVYLANHGIFVLAGSAGEALDITEMTVKTARVLSGVLAVGEPRPLSEAAADRIDTRPDEKLRRERLAAHGKQGT